MKKLILLLCLIPFNVSAQWAYDDEAKSDIALAVKTDPTAKIFAKYAGFDDVKVDRSNDGQYGGYDCRGKMIVDGFDCGELRLKIEYYKNIWGNSGPDTEEVKFKTRLDVSGVSQHPSCQILSLKKSKTDLE